MIPNDPDLALDDTAGRADDLPRVDALPYLLRDRLDAPPVCDGAADVIAGDNLARIPRYSAEGLASLTCTGDVEGSETA